MSLKTIIILTILQIFSFRILDNVMLTPVIPIIIIYHSFLQKNSFFSYIVIFIFGIINDLVQGSSLGLTSCSLLCISYILNYYRHIFVKREFLVLYLYFIPIVAIFQIIQIILLGNFTLDIWSNILLQSLVTIFSYPAIHCLLSIRKKE
jgi:hypothetical protein